MFRESLNRGMLFVFETQDIYPSWMKNTLIPLYIIWIDKDFKVVHIEHAVPCNDTCPSYVPEKKALYVLEANAGFADNIIVGDSLSISK